MSSTLVLFHYFKWHYSRAILEFTQVYKTLLKFVYNFFSIPILIKTFFSPWRRLGEAYPKDKMDFENMASTFVINSLMRLVGIFMRSLLILIGAGFLLFMLLFYPFLVLVWLLLPLLSLFLFIMGLVSLIFIW